MVCCRNLFPENLVEACFRHQGTTYEEKTSDIVPPTGAPGNSTTPTITTMSSVTDMLNATNTTEPKPMRRKLVYKDGMNVLGKCTAAYANHLTWGNFINLYKINLST